MNSLLIYLPYTISFFIGYFFINILFVKDKPMHSLILLFLASGLGLGISAQITFLSFIFFNRLNSTFVISGNILVLFCLFLTYLFLFRKNRRSFNPINQVSFKDVILFIIIIVFVYPLWNHAHFYAFGGWDAWAAWNLKAKIMFLGGEQWQNIFEPILWRSSPHYPLLLPLANVWGWVFLDEPNFVIPVLTSFFFTFWTIGLLCFGLKKFTNSMFSVVPVIVLLTLPFFVKLALSQYCDNTLGYYLLASLFCLIAAKNDHSRIYALLAGLFIGFLSCTKSEGLIASVLITGLSIPHFLWNEKNSSNSDHPKSLILPFFIGAFLAFIPTLIFHIFYAPENQTFINGLTSLSRPVTDIRLETIFKFYLVEI